jgi:outer membrane protein TolC
MRALRSLLVLALAGCALQDPPQREQAAKDALPNFKVPETFSSAAPAQPVQSGWLASFDDPQLDALVQETLANNPDLQRRASSSPRARRCGRRSARSRAAAAR